MDKTRRVSNKGHLDPEHPVSSYFHMALPVVLGSIVTIVYNLADTYEVLGEKEKCEFARQRYFNLEKKSDIMEKNN